MAYAAQIPQHLHDAVTTVSARAFSLSASVVIAAAPNVHGILVTTFERLIFQFGGQVSRPNTARALMGGTYQRHSCTVCRGGQK